MSIGMTTTIWTWIAVGIGVVGIVLIIKFWSYLKEHGNLINIALSATEDIATYLAKEKKISPKIAELISDIRSVGITAVTAAEEKANAGVIPKEDKFKVAMEIAKTILKQKDIKLSDQELEDYINSALNIARATGLLSESKKKETTKKDTTKKETTKKKITKKETNKKEKQTPSQDSSDTT